VGGPVGQAAEGQPSSVICGGEAGRAYVGYYADDLGVDPEWPDIHTNFIVTAKPCEIPVNETTCFPFSPRRLQFYKQGDVDAVKLDASGQVVLEGHINQSRRANKDANGNPFIQTGPTVVDGVSLGIRNSNDHHFDEDRAMYSCASVLRGPNKGDVFFGSNHGVTRIRGLTYNAHRHPVWFDARGSQYAGYTYGLGISPDGDVLIANEWNFGIVTPDTKLENWDDTTTAGINQQKVKSSYLPEVNSQETFDSWRGFQQTTDKKYYLGSKDLGLWEMTILSATNPFQKGTRVGADVPALGGINALASTNDGSLFIGTNTGGLYRLTPSKTVEKVADVRGNKVLQLVYDGSGTSGMLLVLTSEGLTVLRGH
ncbi:hypothetical protein HRD49_26275, partial [Corallococcus exiguus]|uniref:hypothetical protein n=2 Tax=Corallococcus TaxID=83461 RepID=UPI001561723D